MTAQEEESEPQSSVQDPQTEVEHKETNEDEDNEEKDEQQQNENTTALLDDVVDAEVQSEPEEMVAERYVPLPPDGGYGWVIVVASFLGNALVDGMCSTFGVFLPYFIEHYPGASVGKTALAGSLMPCLFLSTGPVASILINFLGCRIVTMVGALITCVALILATFSPTVDVLIVTYGVLGGIGLALMYLPCMVMVGYYFEKRRAMASGIASSGSGFGMLILAPLAAYLVHEYHWQGALLILAGVMLQGLALGAVMRPLPASIPPSADQSESDLTEEEILLAAEQTLVGGRLEKLDETKGSPNGVVHSNYSDHLPKPDESVLLYRKALQNALAKKRKYTLSDGSDSDFSLESQQHLASSKNSDNGLSFQNNMQQDKVKPWNCKMSSTQSCHEFSFSTPPVKRHHRRRAVTESQNNTTLLSHESGRNTAQSCHEISTAKSQSCVHGGDSNRNMHHVGRRTSRTKIVQEMLKPLHRQDIFYSGSIASLAEFKSQPDLKSYLASVTVIPELPAQDGSEQCQCIPRSTVVVDAFRNMIDLSILGNRSFLVICLASVFIQIGYFIPIVYVVDYAVSLGSSSQEAAIIVSVIGISNTLGRSVGGCLANLPWVNYLHLNNVTLVLAGVATLLVGVTCKTFTSLVVYAVVFGFCVGPFVSLSTIFLVEHLGLEKLTNSFGLLSMVRGLSSMAGAPVAGVLLDSTNSYTITFYFGGSMFVVAGFVYYLLPCVKYCTKTNTRTPA